LSCAKQRLVDAFKAYISNALLAANLLLVYAVLWPDATELYICFLYVLWPINGAMACKLFLDKERVMVEK
jgi:hypothetical protein